MSYVPRMCPLCGACLDPGESCDCTELVYTDYLADSDLSDGTDAGRDDNG